METLDRLSLRVNNPYSLGSIFRYNDGSLALDPPILNYVASNQDRYFTVVQGDTLWSIAHEAYGDGKYYWVIQLVNDLDFALDLEIGATLVIPDIVNLNLI